MKQVHLKLDVQDYVQPFEYLQEGRLHHLHRQPVLVLSYPQITEVFSDVQTELPVFWSMPTVSGPATGHC